MPAPRAPIAWLAAGTMLVAALTVATGPSAASPDPGSADPGAEASRQLTAAVTADGVLGHLRALQAIADANHRTRVAGTNGFNASADHVAQEVSRAGYRVTRQRFTFPFFSERRPTVLQQIRPQATRYRVNTDFQLLSYSGTGVAEAPVQAVDLNLDRPRATTSGCQRSDFARFTRGNLALIQRGSCDFLVKARNAIAAGARGILILNQGDGTQAANPDRFDTVPGTLGEPISVPTVFITHALGARLAGAPGTVLRITADTVSENRTAENVIAETPGGRPDNVVMAGGHLDSVPEGPGINDNGSGSAALLEIALKYAPLARSAPNKVRFAWWGAEEQGLLGSHHYVDHLSAAERARIRLYLNFDMIASPNYVLGVYDGDNSLSTSTGSPSGSGEIERVLRTYLTSRGKQAVDSSFDGRSDYGPFIAAGVDIPSGGLFTGAEGMKSAADATRFGGVAGAPYDPCYHQACDGLRPPRDPQHRIMYQRFAAKYGARLVGNVNLDALDINSDAIADAIARFAHDTSALPTHHQTPTPTHT